ncbi:MAG TPA: hypothetical protein DEP05_06030 [Betaproteobacteria bacterium]|nr:hypothetical protein [Betaproteobacteria bacterium]
MQSVPHDDLRGENAPSFHRRLDVCSRLSIPASVELDSGRCVNIVNSEEAAEKLRNGAID